MLIIEGDLQTNTWLWIKYQEFIQYISANNKQYLSNIQTTIIYLYSCIQNVNYNSSISFEVNLHN